MIQVESSSSRHIQRLLTLRTRKRFSVASLSRPENTMDGAISQNMPTIVYQTNRYWLSRSEILLWLSRQYWIPQDILRLEVKLIFSLWHRKMCRVIRIYHRLFSVRCGTRGNRLRRGSHSRRLRLMKPVEAANWHATHCDKVNGPCQQILPSLKWEIHTQCYKLCFQFSAESDTFEFCLSSRGFWIRIRICFPGFLVWLSSKFGQTSK